MKILVTGANGFVGRALCAELSRQEYLVIAALRKGRAEVDGLIQTTVICSIDNNTDWSAALQNVDVVIHLAARVHIMSDHAADPLAEFRKVNVEGTLSLALQATKAGVKRFVFISSIGVNGNVTSSHHPFTAEDMPDPYDAYSTSKYEAEQGLLKLVAIAGFEVVIIRPPLVYGCGAPGNFRRIISALKNHYPLPLGAIKNKRSFVYIDNLVSLIVRCIDHPAAANQVFLVSDGNDLSTTELLRACAGALSLKSRLVPIPQKLIEVFAALIGKENVAQRLCGNLQVDITKARTLLDWTPPTTVEDGLKATAIGFNKVNK
ncbi:SDR family oxidoreductase [Methylotenera sp.]|uniref:UDP-glucose 4-epimerase family protein n=1 Tax=Methylotenera sp. TaxID=2051956 RepID=UPI0024897C43|nr:SDR family oxidoreductase [Methylotenera sp.]MDI1361610.1 SDR family oxidoreductase [Methylotenera sp.]